MTMHARSSRLGAVVLTTLLTTVCTAAHAHEAAIAPGATPPPVPPAALAQLEQVRHAAARYFDVEAAKAAEYVDIGLELPQMGLHLLNIGLVNDGIFDPLQPEALVYQLDPATREYHLVAVEYVTPLTDKPPQGFIGSVDQWGKFGNLFWTLHAWVYEYNPSGVFAPKNPRMP